MKSEFIIWGEPVPKGRPRLGKRGTFTPVKTKQYEELVRFCYENKPYLKGPVQAEIKVFFPTPKSISKTKQSKLIGKPYTKHRGDLDNIIKSILDGLNGVAYDDDTQVWSITSSKTYSDTPRVEVILTETEVR